MIYNNTQKCWEHSKSALLIRGIVYIDENYVEFGYFKYDTLNIPIGYRNHICWLERKEYCHLPLFWANSSGCYVFPPDQGDNIITNSKNRFTYPIDRCYNFCKLQLKPTQLNLIPDPEFKYINKFTIGLEYETCGGNIPWIDCLDKNLIPLYDGSINGHEYVTFPLKNTELSIIKLHLKLLEKYTLYDLNCSLHIHFGNFPITYEKISDLCKYWYHFQIELKKYIPAFSYNTELYKSNGKAYNKPWRKLNNLSQFYEKYTGNIYEDENSFYLPNVFDQDENRKWEVKGRYFNMNIMHLISGNNHKTVEFRFLRPTTCYSEIKWYLLVLSAFLNYVIISSGTSYSKITLHKVLNNTFPKEITEKLEKQSIILNHLHKIQITNGDLAGINVKLKEIYFNYNNFNL